MHFPHHSFCACTSLRLIEITKSVRVIGEFCFCDCGELKKATFESPARVRKIESFAFRDGRSLTSFTVPPSVSAVGDSVFDGCMKLRSVTFDTPSHLRNLPDRLFGSSGALTTLRLPDWVTTITPSAFQESSVISVTGSRWTTRNGLVVRLKKVSCILETPSSIRIPESVRDIGD
jgi:hypothetical protein